MKMSLYNSTPQYGSDSELSTYLVPVSSSVWFTGRRYLPVYIIIIHVLCKLLVAFSEAYRTQRHLAIQLSSPCWA